MSIDAASALCCCGGGQGGISCSEWIACAPASVEFSFSRSDATIRRYPRGGQYIDSVSFVASGTLTRGADGVFRGTISCNGRIDWQYESIASGIAWEEDPQCGGNPWGCPNLDCCATRLERTESLAYSPFSLNASIRCITPPTATQTSIAMMFDAGGAAVEATRERATVFCPDPAIPNPEVTVEQQSAQAAFEYFTGIPMNIGLPSQCLPTQFFDQYTQNETTVDFFAQLSDLICFRRLPVHPYFELVGSCVTESPGGGIPFNCGDGVRTVSIVRTASLA